MLKTLLLTDIPPCVNWTAGQATAQMSLAFEPGELVVFSVTNCDLELERDQRLSYLITEVHGKPNEHYEPDDFTAEEVFALEAEMREREVPRLVAEAVRFGRAHDVDQVWAVLQGQTLVRMAGAVAAGIGVPLKTLIWDTLKWWHIERGIDQRTRDIDGAIFDDVIKSSMFVVAPSWAMADQITSQYGTPSYPIISSIARSVARPAATAVREGQDIVLGIAGQFYASDAWRALVDALDSCGWICAGRNIVVNVYGASAPPDAIDPDKVRLKGWYAQAELVDAIHRECDICYCPYPFDPDLREVSEFSFPSKVVVYLASGRPILFHGPSYSSPGAYLQNRSAGLTCYSVDAPQIIAALEHLIVDGAHYARVAAAGSQAFETDFTLDVQAALVDAHLRPKLKARRPWEKWWPVRKVEDPHALYRPYFDPFHYWNMRRDARGYAGGMLLHYLSRGWRDRSDPNVLFSVSHYLASRPDVDAAGLEPLGHYLAEGWREGTSPHPMFDVRFYLRQRPDVAESGIEPLAHYLATGWREGADPHPLFSTAYYMAQRPRLSASGVCPLVDYLTKGWREGADPHPLFSVSFYLAGRPDVEAAGYEPLSHYLTCGWREGADPHPLFSARSYLVQRIDVAEAELEPLSHYVEHGWREGVNPHPFVDTIAYRQANPDVEAAGCEPLSHYLHVGWREGRSISPWVDDASYLVAHPALHELGRSPVLDCALDGWKYGREPVVWFSSHDYASRNADVNFGREAPFVHYVRTGWREGRNPNTWFSIADFERRSGVPLAREPVIDFLSRGDPAHSSSVHGSAVSDNFRAHLTLRQTARENERLRQLAANVAVPNRDLTPLNPQERCLALVEDVLADVGGHIVHHLENGALHGALATPLWHLLREITQVSDRWLRLQLDELDGGANSRPKR